MFSGLRILSLIFAGDVLLASSVTVIHFSLGNFAAKCEGWDEYQLL